MRNGALLADFLLLFIEACILLTIARLLPNAKATSWGVAVLLLTDAVWCFGIYLLFTRGRRQWKELAWVRINLVVGVLVVGWLVVSGNSLAWQ